MVDSFVEPSSWNQADSLYTVMAHPCSVMSLRTSYFYSSVSKPKDVGQPKPELCFFDDTALVHLDYVGSIHLSGKAALVFVCTCSRSRRVHRLVKNSCQVPVVNVDACTVGPWIQQGGL